MAVASTGPHASLCDQHKLSDAVTSLCESIPKVTGDLGSSVQKLLDIKDGIQADSLEEEDTSLCIWLEDVRLSLRTVVLKLQTYHDACLDLATYGENMETPVDHFPDEEETKTLLEDIRSLICVMQERLSSVLDELGTLSLQITVTASGENLSTPASSISSHLISSIFGAIKRLYSKIATYLYAALVGVVRTDTRSIREEFSLKVNNQLQQLDLKSHVKSLQRLLCDMSDKLTACINSNMSGKLMETDFNRIKKSCCIVNTSSCTLKK